jgi:hypothetical protein
MREILRVIRNKTLPLKQKRARTRLVSLVMTILMICQAQYCAAWANGSNLSVTASDAARLLKIQSQVEQLIEIKARDGKEPTDEQLNLQVALVQKIMSGTLEVRKVTDTIDRELAAEYTAEGEMLARRDAGIELNNITNFTANGVFGLTGGGMHFKGISNAPNDLDLVQGSTTILLSSLALAQMRGGRRKSATDPNMLGQVLHLEPAEDKRFSPLMSAFLTSAPAESKDGLSRQEQLINRWKKAGVITINLDRRKNLERIAATGTVKKHSADTLKIIRNRIVMLHDVHTLVESLDRELVDLLQAID